mmetsp:Transcript_37959/g.90153  ORF Transcript_37959/g.90153 Transcript_37959/m.90153 type:complete len:196 (+) Transcript_37959:934-1521(+)
MHRVDVPLERLPYLHTSWKMDGLEENEGAVVIDSAGNLNDLHLGSLYQAVQTLNYIAAPKRRPTMPPFVVSSANVWGGPIAAVLPGSGVVAVALRGKDTTGAPVQTTIARRPEYGFLKPAAPGSSGSDRLEEGSVVDGGSPWPTVEYVLTRGSPDGGPVVDRFEYAVASAAGSERAIGRHPERFAVVSGRARRPA